MDDGFCNHGYPGCPWGGSTEICPKQAELDEAQEAEAMARRESYEEDAAQEQEASERTKAAAGLSFEALQAAVYSVVRGERYPRV